MTFADPTLKCSRLTFNCLAVGALLPHKLPPTLYAAFHLYLTLYEFIYHKEEIISLHEKGCSTTPTTNSTHNSKECH